MGFPYNLYILQGFPTIRRIFPFKNYGVFLWIIQNFSINIAEKTLYTLRTFYGVPVWHRENLQLLWGKFVIVIGKPHNLFREYLKYKRKTLHVGEYNNLYREKATRIVEVPYYSVSPQCLQVVPKKIMGFTYNIY